MDYFIILYKKFMQVLFILVLYLLENNIGKLILVKLFFEIFGDNVLDVFNNDFWSEFNEQFVGKFLVIVEEILMDKKEDVDKLKVWLIKIKMSINLKGLACYLIDFYCKF